MFIRRWSPPEPSLGVPVAIIVLCLVTVLLLVLLSPKTKENNNLQRVEQKLNILLQHIPTSEILCGKVRIYWVMGQTSSGETYTLLDTDNTALTYKLETEAGAVIHVPIAHVAYMEKL